MASNNPTGSFIFLLVFPFIAKQFVFFLSPCVGENAHWVKVTTYFWHLVRWPNFISRFSGHGNDELSTMTSIVGAIELFASTWLSWRELLLLCFILDPEGEQQTRSFQWPNLGCEFKLKCGEATRTNTHLEIWIQIKFWWKLSHRSPLHCFVMNFRFANINFVTITKRKLWVQQAAEWNSLRSCNKTRLERRSQYGYAEWNVEKTNFPNVNRTVAFN